VADRLGIKLVHGWNRLIQGDASRQLRCRGRISSDRTKTAPFNKYLNLEHGIFNNGRGRLQSSNDSIVH